jgi:hypothetical protein
MKHIRFTLFCSIGFLLGSITVFGQELRWTRSIGGSSWDEASDVKVDKNANVYTVGLFQGTVDFDPGPTVYSLTSVGEKDVFICKLDSAGNFLWAKQFGDHAAIDEKSSLAIDAANNLYITNSFFGTTDFDPGAGNFTLTSQGSDRDIFVQKLDAEGNFIWAKQIGSAAVPMIPTPAHSNAIAVNNTGVYLTGYFDGAIDFDPDPSANYIMTSQFNASDIFVCKLDTSGHFVWAKQFTGTERNGGVGYGIVVDSMDHVYTTGTIGGRVDFDPGSATHYLDISVSNQTEMYLSKLNTDGEFLWAKAMGPGEGSAIALDEQNKLYSSGWFPQGTTPVLNKLDALGNILWARELGGLNGQSIVTDQQGHIYTVGASNIGTHDFDPGAGIYNLTAGNSDGYISKLDSAGNFVWAGLLQGNGQVAINAITIDKVGNLYTTGYFSMTTDFDPAAVVDTLVSNTGSYDVFIQKLGVAQVTSLSNTNLQRKVRVYPNPTTGSLWIDYQEAYEPLELVLRNVIGQKIIRYSVSNKQEIVLPAVASVGVYLLEISDRKKHKSVIKIEKQ